jgi:hypothetical protein
MTPHDPTHPVVTAELPAVPTPEQPSREILPPYGLCAEFDTAEALVAAAGKAREAGYRRMDGYSPFPIEGLIEALGHRPTKLPLVIFMGGLIGGLGGFFLQWYTAHYSYAFNIGGRPLNSWPMFLPVTFECTILGGVLSAVFGMLAMNGLPMPYHPLFHVERFALASRDRFFLAIRAVDPKFDLKGTREFLQGLGAREVTEVPE